MKEKGWVVKLWFSLVFSLQITEMYSSGGDLHLELLSGQLQGTKSLWVSQGEREREKEGEREGGRERRRESGKERGEKDFIGCKTVTGDSTV